MIIRVTLLAFISMLLPLCAHAQAGGTVGGGFFGDYDLRTNAQSGVLAIRPTGSSNVFSGTTFNNEIVGYRAPGANQAIWVETIGAQPARVYVASTSRFSMKGTYYALSSAGGASASRNAFAFTASRAGPGTVAGVPARSLREPKLSGAFVLPGRTGWWMNANSYTSPLVLTIDQFGEVSGLMFGDQVRGHYARDGGKLALLRMKNNVPFQFFVGDVLQPQSGGGLAWLSGVFYSLSHDAGASSARIQFDMQAAGATEFATYMMRALPPATGRCLSFLNSGAGSGTPLILLPCGQGAQEMALIAAPDGFRYMLIAHSGLCLDIPNGSTQAGAAVQQFQCNGGANQRIRLSAAEMGEAYQLKFAHSNLCMGLGASLVLALSTNQVEQLACAPLGINNTFVRP